MSKTPYGEDFESIDSQGLIKLVTGKPNKQGGRKAPVESMIGNRVYAYVNDNNILKSISIMKDTGKFDKQIGGEHIHYLTDKEKRKILNWKKSIMQNTPKRGKMGKAKRSEIENDIHVHKTIDHKKSRARYKLSSKKRRILYESVEMARKKGVAIWEQK